jgi:hypothetical protein
MKMRLEVLALIALGLAVLGVHALDVDWGALAESMAKAHPMGLMQMNF